MSGPKVFPLVRVVWKDSQIFHRWQSISELDDEIPDFVSVGFCVLETELAVSLAQSLADMEADDPDVAGVIRIPRGCIASLEVLQ